MPTYAYACTECEHRFEIVQSFTDDSLTECPKCGGRLRKLFNAVGVVFKGSGFYRTDSRSDRTGRAAAPSNPKSPESASSSTGSPSTSGTSGAASSSGSPSGSSPSGSTASGG